MAIVPFAAEADEMARTKVWVAAAAVWGLVATPAWAHDKRADPCGCHHQYGLRHCHMKMKTEKCEAPVSTVVVKKKKTQKPAQADAKGQTAEEAEPLTAGDGQTAGVSL